MGSPHSIQEKTYLNGFEQNFSRMILSKSPQELLTNINTSTFSDVILMSDDWRDPKNVTLDAVTNTTALIRWEMERDTLGAVAMFGVRYKKTSEQDWTYKDVVYHGFVNNYLHLTRLTPGEEYEIQLAPEYGKGDVGDFIPSFKFTTAAVPCDAPSVVIVSDIRWNTFRVDWEEVPDLPKVYFIRYKKVSDPSTGWKIETNSATEYPAWSFIGLEPDTDYEVQVGSNCLSLGYDIAYSASVYLKTQVAPVCNPPVTLGTTEVTQNSARVNWEYASDALIYNMRYKKAGDPNWIRLPVSGTTYPLQQLDANTDYEVQIASVCAGVGEYSPTISFKTLGSACNPPATIAFTGIATNSAMVNWTQVSNASSYNIRYKKAGDSNWEQVNGNVDNFLSLDNLSAGTHYEVQVASVCGGEQGGFSGTRSFITQSNTSCEVPSTLESNELTPTSAKINWSAVSNDVLGYKVRYKLATHFMWIEVPVTIYGGTSYTLNNINPNTEYMVQVSANCAGQPNTFSSAITFKTLENTAQACEAPSNIEVHYVDTNKASVRWRDLTDTASRFVVRYKKVGELEWTERQVNDNRLAILNLDADTDYELRIASVCNNVQGEFSASQNFKTLSLPVAPACEAPTTININTNGLSENSASVIWQVQNQMAQSYVVRYKKVLESTWTETVSNTNFRMLDGLTADTEYELQIASVCGGTQGDFSTTKTFKTRAVLACEAPKTINVNNITESTASIVWIVQNHMAQSYVFRYKKVSESIWSEVASTINFRMLDGLAADTEYEIQVASVCGGVQGDFSTTKTFKTQVALACEAPTTISINTNGISANSASVVWMVQNHMVQSYVVRYKKVSESIWTETVSNTNFRILDGLTTDTDYELQIASVCGGVQGGFSTTKTFKTQAALACEAPKTINVNNITASTASVVWLVQNHMAQSYVFRYKKVSESAWSEYASTINFRILDGLVADTDYEVQVASICGGVQGDFSTSKTFKTQAALACEAPKTINVNNVTETTASVSWMGQNPTVQSYAVRYRKVSESTWTETNAYYNGINLSSLSADTNYELQVASICEGVQGDFSTVKTFKTQAALACEAPSAIGVNNITPNMARVYWGNPSNVPQSYVIRYRKVSDSTWVGTVSNFANTRDLVSLSADTEYEVQVASVCNGSQSSFSASQNFKTKMSVPCAVPSRIEINSVTESSASIRWRDLGYVAQTFKVRYRKTAESAWTETTAYYDGINLNGLSPDTEYEIQIASVCFSGDQSDYSTSVNFKTTTTPVIPSCDIPEDLNSDNITTNSATITWDNDKPLASRYTVNYRRILPNGDTTTWAVRTVYTKSIDLTGLAADVEFEVRVNKFCNNNGNLTISDMSPIFSFKTLANSNQATTRMANAKDAIKLYPNPVVDVLNVTNVPDNTAYKIYNASGLEVNAGKINNNKINVSHLMQGNYIIMIEQGKDLFRSQFIKR